MLEKLLNKEIIIPHDKLRNVKIRVGDYTITLEEFIEIKIRQILEEAKNNE